jgi:hypothetical protein
MGAVNSVVNAVSDIVSPVIDVASNVVKAVADNPIAAIGAAALTGGASLAADALGVTASDILGAGAADALGAGAADAALADTATGLASLPSSVASAADAFGAAAPAVDAGTSAIQAGLAANPVTASMGSLANIPGNIGGGLPTGGGLDTSAAATGLSSAPTAVDPNVIGTTSNFATGLQTNAVIDPVTGTVTNVPTGQSLSGTTGTAIPGNATTPSLPKSATPASTTPTAGSLGSSTINNFTDILGSLAQSGLTGDKTGRTLLQPSMFQTSSPQNVAQILGALKQLNIPMGNQPALSQYHPQLINAVRQNMARGGRPHQVNHPEAELGEHIFRTGGPSNYVRGKGDGQSDDIPAMLADGEYVLDAELVSQLGDGSNKAGAEKLDKFREAIRRHKRSAPDNKIPPKAKKLTSYLKEAERG